MQVALTNNSVRYDYSSHDDAFPACDPNVTPTGSRVLVQLRTPKRKTAGGLILPDEVRETDHWNTQCAKVVSVGPMAFRNRNTGEQWPEGDWCVPGDFVRVPKYGGDRWEVDALSGEDRVTLVIFNDLDITAKVNDPLSMVSFL